MVGLEFMGTEDVIGNEKLDHACKHEEKAHYVGKKWRRAPPNDNMGRCGMAIEFGKRKRYWQDNDVREIDFVGTRYEKRAKKGEERGDSWLINSTGIVQIGEVTQFQIGLTITQR